MPKISVLVPIFNVEKYLSVCLESLINQTLKDIEIICINDGSTDNSLQIINEYAKQDRRIKVVNKNNSGYGDSMNKGLEVATGEYIGIVESDDFVKNTMFEELFNLAIENDLDIVKSDFYYYTAKNNLSRQAGKIKKNIVKVFSVKDDLSILKLMPTIWSAIYRRNFLEKNNIKFLPTAGASYQDTSFAFKALVSAERIMFTNKAYLFYRQDNENSSVNSRKKVYAICDEWEEITNYINSKPELKSFVNDIKLAIQFNSYLWNAIRIDEIYRNEFISKFKDTFKFYLDNGEINELLCKAIGKKELDLLLNDTEKFRKLVDHMVLKKNKKLNRRKLFSVRINSSRISFVMFGKQIVELGKN